jgi:hypothetical protein
MSVFIFIFKGLAIFIMKYKIWKRVTCLCNLIFSEIDTFLEIKCLLGIKWKKTHHAVILWWNFIIFIVEIIEWFWNSLGERGRRGRNRMVVGLTTTCAINAWSAQKLWVWIPPCGVCSIQQYMIKFLSDLQKIYRFLRVLRISPQIKNYWHDITEILLKVALSIISSMELYGMKYIVLTSKTN